MNLEEKMKQDFSQELVVPDIVDEKLRDVYQHIRDAEKGKNPDTNLKRKTRRMTAWISAAAAIGIVVTAGGILYSNPALASDLPIIGNLFEKIADANAYSNPKDNTAYEQIEKHSEKTATSENHIEDNTSHSGNIAADSGVEVCIADAYYDGYDLYFTLSIRTEDEELNSSEFLTPLTFVEGDNIPFWVEPVIDGAEDAWTATMLQPRKSSDGSFVQLVRVSLSSESLFSMDTLDVKLEFNAIGGTRLEDIGTYQDAVHEWMGHKTIRGDWKLAFQASKNLSDHKKLITPSENQGFIVTAATATPGNLHLTIQIPSGVDSNILTAQIFDSNGQKVDVESIGYDIDGNGQSILLITAHATEMSQFMVKIIDKSAGAGDEMITIAEIPFELQ